MITTELLQGQLGADALLEDLASSRAEEGFVGTGSPVPKRSKAQGNLNLMGSQNDHNFAIVHSALINPVSHVRSDARSSERVLDVPWQAASLFVPPWPSVKDEVVLKDRHTDQQLRSWASLDD